MEYIKLAGFLLVNKPKGLTSFAVVKHIRKLLGKRIRVGHTGTLDPFATGLLIIAIDRTATKHINKLLTLDKTYRATAKLGELTDTLDPTGTLIQSTSFTGTKQDIEKAISSLGTSYTQTPPLYSALKHKGMRLYDLARNNQMSPEQLEQITQLKQRKVQLYNLELLNYSPPNFTLNAKVSSGTYIRSLVNDIAKKAGSVATITKLERTDIGPFNLNNAASLENLTSFIDIEKNLIPIKTKIAMYQG